MSFQSQSGNRKFNSKFRASRYDDVHSSNDSAHEQADHGDASAAPPVDDGGQGAEAASGIQDVIAQHGPAHDVHITHDPMSGMHHMHSIHQDGYEHHSDHPDPESAHEDGKMAAGVLSDGDADDSDDEMAGEMDKKKRHADRSDHSEPDDDDYEPEPLEA